MPSHPRRSLEHVITQTVGPCQTMIFTSSHRFWVVGCFAGVLGFGAPLLASQQADHGIDYKTLTIEHAEVIRGMKGMPDVAYLTIFNGSISDKRLTRVSIPGYKNAILMQRTDGAGTARPTPLTQAFVVIPKQAELFMGPDTLFFELEAMLGFPQGVSIEAEFDDGSSLVASLTIRAPGSKRTDHHHGDGD